MVDAGLALLYLLRSLALLGATLGFAGVFVLARAVAPNHAPRLLRRYLAWCGGGFVTLGQVVATRFDLVSPAYCRELQRLTAAPSRVSIRRIRAILAADLGPRADELGELEDVPLGGSATAQVHGARLADGTEVVVKVRRPGVARRLRIDLAQLRALARFAEWLGVFGGRDLAGLVAEVARMSHEELDFRREAFQADLMHRRLAADALDHAAPAVWFAYSSPRVVTLQRFRGVWVSELIALARAGDRPALARLAARGITPERIARLLLRSMLTQCLVHQVFHADPDPTNVVILEGGTLGYVDFGRLGRLDERLAGLQLRVVEGLVAERYQAAADALLATIEPVTLRNPAPFRTQVQELYATWRMIAGHPQARLAEKSAGVLFLQVADLARRAGLQLPPPMMRYYRAQLVCDQALDALDPCLDPIAELAELLSDARNTQLWASLHTNLLMFWRTLAVDGPRAADALVRWIELRLPRLGEAYGNQVTGLERAAWVVVGQLERGLWLAGAAVAGFAVLRDPGAVAVGPVPWWGVTAMLLAVAHTVRRARQATTDPS